VKLFGDEFVVPFEPVVLDEMRTKVRRRLGVVAGGWLFLIPVTAGLVWLAGSAGPGILAVLWLVLLVPMVYLMIALFLALARTTHWAEGNLPARAMRLTADGLWLATPASYPWESVTGLVLRKERGQPVLAVELAPGVTPDLPVTVGLESADHGAAIRRRLGSRGPRVVPETLGLPLADLDAAVRHYCRDGAGIRGLETLPARRF
jgi:hypothetical protein